MASGESKRGKKSDALETSRSQLLDTSQSNPSTSAETETNAFSPLLKLPPEIRNRIYKLVLGGLYFHTTIHAWRYARRRAAPMRTSICVAEVSDTEALASAKDQQDREDALLYTKRHRACESGTVTDEAPKLRLDLLRTCRQIHHEAALLPFQLNTFGFFETRCIIPFLKRLSVGQQRAIATVVIWALDSDDSSGIMIAAKALSGISTLHAYFHTWSRNWKVPALEGEVLPRFLAFQNPNLKRVRISIELSESDGPSYVIQALREHYENLSRKLERRLLGETDDTKTKGSGESDLLLEDSSL